MSTGDVTGVIPQVYQWDANVQRQFAGNIVAEVGYVGTRARHLVIIPDLNQLPLGVGSAALATNPNYNLLAFAPYPGLGLIQAGLNEGNSQYDSLQVSVQKRMSKGLQIGLAYTYSHSYDNGSSRTASIPDTYNLRTSWGPSDFQRNNIFILNYYYELPWLRTDKSLKGHILGGWALGGVVSFETGVPYTVTDSGNDTAQVGYDPSSGGHNSGGQQAQLVPGCSPNNGPQSIYQCFNTSCFTLPATGTFGNAGRNSVWGPDLFDWDLTLNKSGLTRERVADFRAQFFNILNHPSFGCNNCLDTGIKDSNFGYVTNSIDPREIQLSLRVHF